MAYDETLAARVRGTLAPHGAEEKAMFGGIAFMVSGNMCCGVLRDDLIVRTFPEDAVAALDEQHVREFDVTGRPMTGWLLVEPGATESDEGLRAWVGRALAFVRTLPPK